MKIPPEAILSRNPYSYALDINHPVIFPYYMRFKRWKGIPVWCPLSDGERAEFENHMKKTASIPISRTEIHEASRKDENGKWT